MYLLNNVFRGCMQGSMWTSMHTPICYQLCMDYKCAGTNVHRLWKIKRFYLCTEHACFYVNQQPMSRFQRVFHGAQQEWSLSGKIKISVCFLRSKNPAKRSQHSGTLTLHQTRCKQTKTKTERNQFVGKNPSLNMWCLHYFWVTVRLLPRSSWSHRCRLLKQIGE